MTDPDIPVVVVVPGDLHLTEPDLENVRVAHWMVDEVNGLIRPDFVQFIGDNVQDATEAQFRLFDDLRGRLEVPHFALIGDHDVKDDPLATGFRRHVGEPYGAISLRGFRFIRLNTQESRPVGLSAEQIDWFRGEVDSALAAGERVVVFQHNYPYQIWEDFDGPGIDEWRAIVQTRRIEAIVCGHTHYWQVANDGRNVVDRHPLDRRPGRGAAGVYAALLPRRRSGGDLPLGGGPRTRRPGDAPARAAPGDRPPAHRQRPRPGGRANLVRRRASGPSGTASTREPGPAWSRRATAIGRGRCPATGWPRESTSWRSSPSQPTTPRDLSGSASWSTRRADYTAVPEARPVVTSTAFC